MRPVLKRDTHEPNIRRVAMAGSLPPLRALSAYCLGLASAVSELIKVEFVSFKSIYPKFLYPGGRLENDTTFSDHRPPGLNVRRKLTWYNPVSWLIEGLTAKGDLLHVQWWSLPLFPIFFILCLGFKLRKKPIVITVHNVQPHEKSGLFRLLSGWLFKLGDHFILHSESNRRQMEVYYRISAANLSVLPHGALDCFVGPRWDCTEARRRLGYQSHERVLLLFGAVREYKGVDTALHAFQQIHSAVPEARLLIAGKVWGNWEPYARLIQTLGIERSISLHLDYIPAEKVSLFFTVADLVLLPYHRFDSQSGVGATAIAFRKPMIVSDVGGLPELTRNRSQIVQPCDPIALATAVIRHLQDPRQMKSAKADTEHIAETLAWSSIAKETLSVYKKVLNRQRKRQTSM